MGEHRSELASRCLLAGQRLPSVAKRGQGVTLTSVAKEGGVTVQASADLNDEIINLRRGRGLTDPQLVERVGPLLRESAEIGIGDSVATAREKLKNLFDKSMKDSPADLADALRYALGYELTAPYTQLSQRLERYAQLYHLSLRTARRRADLAARTAATGILGHRLPEGESRRVPDSFRVLDFRGILRLDLPQVELHETRTVVAERDGLDGITIRLDVPAPRGDDHPAGLAVDALFGAVVADAQMAPEARHYAFRVRFPRSLARGEEHEFGLIYRLPVAQPMRPHYAVVPLDPMESSTVRVRFDRAKPPRAVWRLAGVPPRLLDEAAAAPNSDLLKVDGVGEVALAFRHLRQGHGYGIAWAPR
jgi:hypothetical protein